MDGYIQELALGSIYRTESNLMHSLLGSRDARPVRDTEVARLVRVGRKHPYGPHARVSFVVVRWLMDASNADDDVDTHAGSVHGSTTAEFFPHPGPA
jgi:hypothetical protein